MLSCSFCSICRSGLDLPFYAFLYLLAFIFAYVWSAAFISVYFTIRFGGSVSCFISIPAFLYVRLWSLLLLSQVGIHFLFIRPSWKGHYDFYITLGFFFHFELYRGVPY